MAFCVLAREEARYHAFAPCILLGAGIIDKDSSDRLRCPLTASTRRVDRAADDGTRPALSLCAGVELLAPTACSSGIRTPLRISERDQSQLDFRGGKVARIRTQQLAPAACERRHKERKNTARAVTTTDSFGRKHICHSRRRFVSCQSREMIPGVFTRVYEGYV